MPRARGKRAFFSQRPRAAQFGNQSSIEQGERPMNESRNFSAALGVSIGVKV